MKSDDNDDDDDENAKGNSATDIYNVTSAEKTLTIISLLR